MIHGSGGIDLVHALLGAISMFILLRMMGWHNRIEDLTDHDDD